MSDGAYLACGSLPRLVAALRARPGGALGLLPPWFEALAQAWRERQKHAFEAIR